MPPLLDLRSQRSRLMPAELVRDRRASRTTHRLGGSHGSGRRREPVWAGSIVVEVGEQLPIGDELFLQPGAILGRQILKHLGREIPINLAHNLRIPTMGRGRSLAAASVTTFGTQFCHRESLIHQRITPTRSPSTEAHPRPDRAQDGSFWSVNRLGQWSLTGRLFVDDALHRHVPEPGCISDLAK
jgi:hypothetical protein